MKFDGQIINGNLENLNCEDKLETHSHIVAFYGRLNNKEQLVSNINLKNSEIVLEYYSKYNEKCLEYFDGNYSFVIYSKEDHSLFLAKDRLGTKPLYYIQTNTSFIFATDIKDIFKNYNVGAVLGKEELCELLGVGPAHTPRQNLF